MGVYMSSPVSALRKLTKLDSTHEHHAAFVEQLAPDTNHRGACLILTANVETALDTAVQQVLRLDEDSRLLEDEDLYSAFARKIELGSALRIYGPQTKSNLTYIRHIRNAFAHAKRPLTFDTPEVKAVCDLLAILPVLPPAVVRKQPDKMSLTPRQLFEETASVIAHNLVGGPLNLFRRSTLRHSDWGLTQRIPSTSDARRPCPKPFTSAPSPPWLPARCSAGTRG